MRPDCFLFALNRKASSFSPLSIMLTVVFHKCPLSGWWISLLFLVCFVLLFFLVSLCSSLGSFLTFCRSPGSLSMQWSLLWYLILSLCKAPSFQLRECSTLVPPVWKLTAVSLDKHRARLVLFPFLMDHCPLLPGWCPMSLKYFFWGEGVLSKKIHLVLITPSWMEMEVTIFWWTKT